MQTPFLFESMSCFNHFQISVVLCILLLGDGSDDDDDVQMEEAGGKNKKTKTRKRKNTPRAGRVVAFIPRKKSDKVEMDEDDEDDDLVTLEENHSNNRNHNRNRNRDTHSLGMWYHNSMISLCYHMDFLLFALHYHF